MLSVNTNMGAMIALQNLSKTNRDMETTQNRINTGLSVSSAKDNGGIYAIAQNMRGEVGALNAVGQSLNRSKSIVDVALAAGETISDLIVQMKEKALAAADASNDTTARLALNEDFVALRKQIASIVSNAAFSGVNIINNTTTKLEPLASASASKLTVLGENMSLGGSIITITATGQITTQAAASTMMGTINTSLTNVNRARAAWHVLQAAFAAGRVRDQAFRQPQGRHRQSRRRRPGQGKRPAPGAAGQAAAGDTGAVDREQFAVDHHVAVQVIESGS